MALYGLAWPYMAFYGLLWSYLIFYGRISSFLAVMVLFYQETERVPEVLVATKALSAIQEASQDKFECKTMQRKKMSKHHE